jgi:hypothetical protein
VTDAFREATEDALILVGLGIDDGGRVDPDRILSRPPLSRSRQMFTEAQDSGWLDGEGWVTEEGRRAVETWRAQS